MKENADERRLSLIRTIINLSDEEVLNKILVDIISTTQPDDQPDAQPKGHETGHPGGPPPDPPPGGGQ